MNSIQVDTSGNKRLYFLDNLKAFIILLVIVFHIALGYMAHPPEYWYVIDTQKHSFFDLFVLETDVYIMPIMFMIAGYFTLPVLLKKGIVSFWQDKFWRIVLPWAAGALFLAPPIAYSIIFSRTSTPPNYFTFWANDFWGEYFQQAHYWFLGILTLFFLLTTAIYKLNPAIFKKSPEAKIPSNWFLLLFTVFSAIPFFLANLYFPADLWFPNFRIIAFQPVRLGILACYFGLGIYAWKNSWFTAKGYMPNLWGWSISAILTCFVFLFYRVTYTFNPNITPLFKAGHALMFAVFTITATLALIAVFYSFINSEAYLWRRLAANSYIIYFIHQCVVIPLAYIVQKSPVNVWVKYLGVSLTAVVLCFLISEYIISPILGLIKRNEKKIESYPYKENNSAIKPKA